MNLIIKPIEIITGEEVLFGAVKDNDGKGLPIKDLITAVSEIFVFNII